MNDRPTPEGQRRYEPDGFYTANGDAVPCTCKPECPFACKGACGCEACRQSFADFGLD